MGTTPWTRIPFHSKKGVRLVAGKVDFGLPVKSLDVGKVYSGLETACPVVEKIYFGPEVASLVEVRSTRPPTIMLDG